MSTKYSAHFIPEPTGLRTWKQPVEDEVESLAQIRYHPQQSNTHLDKELLWTYIPVGKIQRSRDQGVDQKWPHTSRFFSLMSCSPQEEHFHQGMQPKAPLNTIYSCCLQQIQAILFYFILNSVAIHTLWTRSLVSFIY